MTRRLEGQSDVSLKVQNIWLSFLVAANSAAAAAVIDVDAK